MAVPFAATRVPESITAWLAVTAAPAFSSGVFGVEVATPASPSLETVLLTRPGGTGVLLAASGGVWPLE